MLWEWILFDDQYLIKFAEKYALLKVKHVTQKYPKVVKVDFGWIRIRRNSVVVVTNRIPIGCDKRRCRRPHSNVHSIRAHFLDKQTKHSGRGPRHVAPTPFGISHTGTQREWWRTTLRVSITHTIARTEWWKPKKESRYFARGPSTTYKCDVLNFIWSMLLALLLGLSAAAAVVVVVFEVKQTIGSAISWCAEMPVRLLPVLSNGTRIAQQHFHN